MCCTISCGISLIFVIGMIYFYSATSNSTTVKYYKDKMPRDLQIRYEKIARERTMISYYGYGLGIILSMLIIYYNTRVKHNKLNAGSLVCAVVATSFLVNYFYYMLSPKSDWMLDHITNKEQIKLWLQVYREMQYNYHLGLVLGIIAVGMLGYAFRC